MLDILSSIPSGLISQDFFFIVFYKIKLWSLFTILQKEKRMVDLLERDFIEVSKMKGRRRLFFFSYFLWADNVSENYSFHIRSHPLTYVSLPYATICFIKFRVVFLKIQPYIVPLLLEISLSNRETSSWRCLSGKPFIRGESFIFFFASFHNEMTASY